jgi:hypothetical protein
VQRCTGRAASRCGTESRGERGGQPERRRVGSRAGRQGSRLERAVRRCAGVVRVQPEWGQRSRPVRSSSTAAAWGQRGRAHVGGANRPRGRAPETRCRAAARARIRWGQGIWERDQGPEAGGDKVSGGVAGARGRRG